MLEHAALEHAAEKLAAIRNDRFVRADRLIIHHKSDICTQNASDNAVLNMRAATERTGKCLRLKHKS